MDAHSTLAALGPHWRAAFDEAWASWQAGNFGIGAVLVDPTTDTIVSRGRNRVTERDSPAGTIGGNMMGHAEMNAFSSLPRWNADGLHLYTTLEPCLMCAATTIFLGVDHVHLAARDEWFRGLDDLWEHHEYTSERRPETTGPLPGRVGAFARLLPTTFTVLFVRNSAVVDRAREAAPRIVELAEQLQSDNTLADVAAEGGSVADALAAIWDRLPD